VAVDQVDMVVGVEGGVEVRVGVEGGVEGGVEVGVGEIVRPDTLSGADDRICQSAVANTL